MPRESCVGLQGACSRQSSSPDNLLLPTHRALTGVVSAQSSSGRTVDGAGRPAVTHQGSRPEHPHERSQQESSTRICGLQATLSHMRAQVQPEQLLARPSSLPPLLPATTESVDSQPAFSAKLTAAQTHDDASLDMHLLCDEGEVATASVSPASESLPPHVLSSHAGYARAPLPPAPECAAPPVALQDSRKKAAELLLGAAQTAAPLRQGDGGSSACTQTLQPAPSCPASAADQSCRSSLASSGVMPLCQHESGLHSLQPPQPLCEFGLTERWSRQLEQLRRLQEPLLPQQQQQAGLQQRQHLIPQQLAQDRQLHLVQQQSQMQPHHFQHAGMPEHLQHLDQSVPPQLYADETLAPPPAEDEGMLAPTADDDGVAALLLGFGAAPRIEAPRAVAPRDEWSPSAYATYRVPSSDAGDVRGRVMQQGERPPAVAPPASKRVSVGGRLRRDAAEMDTDDIRDQEIAIADGWERDEGDDGWSEGEHGTQRHLTDDDADEDADEDEQGGAVLADVIDLHNLSPRAAVGLRLQVSYMERQGKQLVAVPYRGEVVSVDMRKGLRVKLDGYVRREWVTDEDEWMWLERDDQAMLPHQQELLDKTGDAAGKAKASSKANGSAAKPAAAAPPAPSYAHVQIKLSGTFVLRMPECVRLMPPHKPLAVSFASDGSEGEEEMPAEDGPQQLPPGSSEHEHDGKALSSAEHVEVTVCAGAHAGEKATVLHVGNGWVRVAVESGAVVHLRKWDLSGEIPIKLRSPSHTKPLAKLEPAVPEEPEMVAGAPGPSARDERAAERAALVAGKGAEDSSGKATGNSSGKGNGSSSGNCSENSLGERAEFSSRKGADDSLGKSAESKDKGAEISSDKRAEHKDKGAEISSGKRAEHKDNGAENIAENSSGKGAKSSSGKVTCDSSGNGDRRSDAPKEADMPAPPAEAPPDETAAAPSVQKPRKRPPPELAAEGFEVGASVWARLSFIKFSHGVIHKVQSSSKWVMVRLDSGTDQWVTARELVLDSTPEQADLYEGLEVIAAWPGEEHWYKGTIVEIADRGGYRVQYDDWDEQTVDLTQIRTLPETFGGKRKKEHESKHKHVASSSASVKPLSHRRSISATAKSADAQEAVPMDARATGNSARARVGAAAVDGTLLVCQPDAVYASMDRFVGRARDQLLPSAPDTFERLSQLLGRFEATVAAAGRGASAAGPELQSLLAPHPSLLSELESLLALAPAPSPDGHGGVSPADAEALVEMEIDESADRVSPAGSAAGFASSAIDVKEEEAGSNSPASSDADEVSSKLIGPDVEPALKGESRQERTIPEDSRGHKGKGTRELQKLLDEFGGGAAVGVDGDMRRRRGFHEA